jgi:malate dehydrogenase (oxaloacetate-decarboxylating)(NADP+)
MVDNKEKKQLTYEEEEPLLYHEYPQPGKYTIKSTKPMNNQKDLSLAYSPGVAVPCMEIHRDPSLALRYTGKGNTVAVITNGTAVLGLGNIGALAAKPVMEGKAVLFSKFAGVESLDLCIDAKDPDDFVNCVRFLGPSFAGINLEDIKAPDCFYVEEKLKELMDIPVFHDDQHGTAIVTLAGFINSCIITGRDASKCKIVLNGAGAAGIACITLLHKYGVPKENIVVCDTKGVIYQGRTEGMNKYKEQWVTTRPERTLKEALKGADMFIGVSSGNLLTAEDVKQMADKPIIYAMANPVPEIYPDEARRGCPDAIIATGRSDFPNQINNVMCFPFLFRGTLDAGAKQINDEMKFAVA